MHKICRIYVGVDTWVRGGYLLQGMRIFIVGTFLRLNGVAYDVILRYLVSRGRYLLHRCN